MKFTKKDKTNKKEFSEEEKEAVAQQEKRNAEFNKNMLTDLLFFVCFIMLVLFVFSFIPQLGRFDNVFNFRTKCLFGMSFGFFVVWLLLIKIFKNLSLKHSLLNLYIFFAVSYVFAVIGNIFQPSPQPFILLVGFRILFGVLIKDDARRIEVFNNIMLAAAVFGASYFFKPTDVFIEDVILVSVFTSMSIVLTSVTQKQDRLNQEMSRKLFDSKIEVEKAKNDAKTSFMANMSHEIRTPVNSIMGLNEMLIRENKDPKVLEYARNIKSSSNTLLKLINDILDFSKIESGKMEIINAEYELSSVITDLINMVSPRVKTKNLDFKLKINPEMPHLLYGDEVRVKQCMLNVLTNAVKYTEKGFVEMSLDFERLSDTETNIIFCVKDSGIGIRKEDLPKLFSEFERLEERRNRTIEGSGLGLNIVNMLLKLMGSELKVQSEYEKGSEFSFKIKQNVMWWDPIGNFNDSYENYLQSLENYRESFHAPNAHILIVDDTKMNLVVAVGLLKETQVQIDTALSAKEMFNLISKKKYDVIFLDHRMPEIDGVEAFHVMSLMENNLNKNTPCVALTANVVSGAKEFYLNEGFSGYLAKPIDSAKLEKMLVSLLPRELVKYNVGSSSQEKSNGTKPSQEKSKIPEGLEGIDMEEAMQNCGEEEILYIALKEYYDMIAKRSEEIEQCVLKKDFKNYTIQTHALKSSSRLIGAIELSKKAAYLEKCGDEKNEAEILAKTPELLELYRSYLKKLAPLNPEPEAEGLEPLLEEDKFKEAMSAIKEFAASFDFNAADSVIQMLDGYEIPESGKEIYKKVKQYIRAGDSAAILKAL